MPTLSRPQLSAGLVMGHCSLRLCGSLCTLQSSWGPHGVRGAPWSRGTGRRHKDSWGSFTSWHTEQPGDGQAVPALCPRGFLGQMTELWEPSEEGSGGLGLSEAWRHVSPLVSSWAPVEGQWDLRGSTLCPGQGAGTGAVGCGLSVV